MCVVHGEDVQGWGDGDSVRPKEMNAGREVTLLHGNNI